MKMVWGPDIHMWVFYLLSNTVPDTKFGRFFTGTLSSSQMEGLHWVHVTDVTEFEDTVEKVLLLN